MVTDNTHRSSQGHIPNFSGVVQMMSVVSKPSKSWISVSPAATLPNKEGE